MISEISAEIFFRLAVPFFARSAALRATSLALSRNAMTPKKHILKFQFDETFFKYLTCNKKRQNRIFQRQKTDILNALFQ